MSEIKGQVSMFDLDMPFGKMCRVHSVPIRERTSELCWKNLQESKKTILQYLDARSGQSRESSTGTLSALLGEPLMHNTLAVHSGENEFVYYVISGGHELGTYCLLNPYDHPVTPVESHLSWIIQEDVDERYYLSERACQGILNRATKRGKALPEILQRALENVIHSKLGGVLNETQTVEKLEKER